MYKRIVYLVVLIFLLSVSVACANSADKPTRSNRVVIGIERIDEFKDLFAGKRVGLITNATGIDRNFRDSASILAQKVNLVAIFSPEHGYLGQVTAGKDVGTYTDQRLGVTVYSLYGSSKRPSAEMMQNVDVLVFDIQDIGARNYTYIYTMAYAMEACAQYNKEFVVLDRPNPLGGKVEGPVLKKGFESFIGLYPIPYRHGLTPGEAARLFNNEYGINAKLTVIPMLGWTRNMYFEETGLPWVMTSPNIPTLDSVMGYVMTGYYGGLDITNGVGTTRPFEIVGATWADAHRLAFKMNAMKLPGVYFRATAFTPRFGSKADVSHYGVQIHFTNKKAINAVETGARLFYALREMKGAGVLKAGEANRIDKNLGENAIWDNQPLEQMLARWREESRLFEQKVQPYLLYR